MKIRLITLVAALSVSLILLSLVVPVNHPSQLPTQKGVGVVADGVPLPPPIPPPPKQLGALLADGVPLPPPIPPSPKQASGDVHPA
jgi:hypothetical protein